MLRTVAATLMAIILVSACSAASSPAPSSGTSPAASTGFDPSAITRHGHPVRLAVVPGRGQCPDPDAAPLPVGLSQREGRLPAARWRLRRRDGRQFASRDVPDVFYVDAGYAQQWIDQGYLAPLDDYIAKSAFDTTQFFDGYASIFKGADGKTYGLPKDGNTIAMAYNTPSCRRHPRPWKSS